MHLRDARGRVRAVVWADGQNVNVEVVHAGLARRTRRTLCRAYCHELQAAEREARQAGVGMWSLER